MLEKNNIYYSKIGEEEERKESKYQKEQHPEIRAAILLQSLYCPSATKRYELHIAVLGAFLQQEF